MAGDGKSFALLLRYQAQADRQYRRAVEDFERLVREREEISQTNPFPPPPTPTTTPRPQPASPCPQISPASPRRSLPLHGCQSPGPRAPLRSAARPRTSPGYDGPPRPGSPRDRVPILPPKADQPCQAGSPARARTRRPPVLDRRCSLRPNFLARVNMPSNDAESASGRRIQRQPRPRRELPPHSRCQEDRAAHRVRHHGRMPTRSALPRSG